MERPVAVSVRRSPSLPDYNTSTSTLAFDQHFTTTLKGILLQAEISLCINCIATALYLVTAVVDALSVNQDVRGRHNYNCWAASAFFAFLTTLCYAGSSYLSYRTWKTTEEEQ
ncbi:CKLF-like MARVEL transmembrane domain-containing protein 8b isoform X2 [Oreochromis aureus]|uniref:CKLF-like MARVEL transmembrane domain-containing protein 8b isoform X2 n=1 Tax=Oreochromis aureus TaxID=47969 RepID=UPI001952FEAB|nr:CKLF-like MARVEL transmembrane domain-containing protein 8b isoform X2 [Oreochromis aureus]